MKRGSINFSKAALLLVGLSAGMLFTISSCKKDDSTTQTISDDDISEAVSESVSTQSGGLVVQSTAAAGMTYAFSANRTGAKIADQCGVLHDTTIAGASVAGAAITYSYNFSWNWLLTCDNVVPQMFVWNYAGKASYDAPRMSSSDSSKANITVTGLGGDTAYYVFNQTYVRNGSQTSKINEKRSFTSVITITSSDVKISKSTLKILSGTGVVSITGTGSGGYTFTRTGTITFLGEDKATLVLTNGKSYTITW
jgi:hypothetical protein